MSPYSTRGHKCDLSQLRFLLRSFSSLAPNGGEVILRGYGWRLFLRITHVLWHKHRALLFPSGFQSVSLHSHCGISFLSPRRLLVWSSPYGVGRTPLGIEDHSAAGKFGATAPGPEAKAHPSHAPQGLTPTWKRNQEALHLDPAPQNYMGSFCPERHP